MLYNSMYSMGLDKYQGLYNTQIINGYITTEQLFYLFHHNKNKNYNKNKYQEGKEEET